MVTTKIICSIAAIGLIAGQAAAEGWYVSGAAGVNIQTDSDNDGVSGAFTTGNLGDGTTLDVAAGTDYAWETDFDTGFAFAGEVGYRLPQGFRAGFEISFTNADVDTHTDVTLAGGAIGTLDAAALAGSPDPLGVSIADLVADGQGEIDGIYYMANAYYDFNTTGLIQPYLGVGIGIADIDVEYAPSAVPIIDDGETLFAYQFKAGTTFKATEKLDVFVEYAFRGTDDIETENDLFPGTLEIENRQNLVMAGARFNF